MDPFISTIIKESLMIFAVIAVLGFLVALGYGALQYGKLQHAMTLNMVPSPLT